MKVSKTCAETNRVTVSVAETNFGFHLISCNQSQCKGANQRGALGFVGVLTKGGPWGLEECVPRVDLGFLIYLYSCTDKN